jgi:hypothetical protein
MSKNSQKVYLRNLSGTSNIKVDNEIKITEGKLIKVNNKKMTNLLSFSIFNKIPLYGYNYTKDASYCVPNDYNQFITKKNFEIETYDCLIIKASSIKMHRNILSSIDLYMIDLETAFTTIDGNLIVASSNSNLLIEDVKNYILLSNLQLALL